MGIRLVLSGSTLSTNIKFVNGITVRMEKFFPFRVDYFSEGSKNVLTELSAALPTFIDKLKDVLICV